MNTAVKDPEEGMIGESPAVEIPALLVAGGSCSRLCRSQRAATEDQPPNRAPTQSLQSTRATRAPARE